MIWAQNRLDLYGCMYVWFLLVNGDWQVCMRRLRGVNLHSKKKVKKNKKKEKTKRDNTFTKC